MSAQFTALLAAIVWLQAGAVPSGNHTCTGVIKHPVTVLVNVTEPVTYRSYTWCLRVPPRCSKYTVQLKDRVKLHTEMHNKTITVCCRGYVEMENRCVPACPEDADCPFMKCNRTNHCYCTPGFTGLYCNDPCPRGLWGKDCKRPCDCPSGYTCHHLTGDCFVDDSPPRRTTTTTTTTKRPTTTTAIPTTQGTTLETVKTPVFRFPPPPWVDSASVGKKTTTRQVRNEEAPPTKEMDAQSTGEIMHQTTTRTLSPDIAALPPIPVTEKPSIERPPILDFLPPLPSEEPVTTKEITTESSKLKITETVRATTGMTHVRTFSKPIETTTIKSQIEKTTATQLPATKLVFRPVLEANTVITETTLKYITPQITLSSSQPTQGETVPKIADIQSQPAQTFVTIDIESQTITPETLPITTTTTLQPTKKASPVSITPTKQPAYKFNVTQDTNFVENTLENEILTNISDPVLNMHTLNETEVSTTTRMTDINSKINTILNPFFLLPITEPSPPQSELINKSKNINEEATQTFFKQRQTTVPILITATEEIQREMTVSDVKKVYEAKSTNFKENSKITLPNQKQSEETLVYSASTLILPTELKTKALTWPTEQITTPIQSTLFKLKKTTTSTTPAIEATSITKTPTMYVASTETTPLLKAPSEATATSSTNSALIITPPTAEITTAAISTTAAETISTTFYPTTTTPTTDATTTTIPTTVATTTTIPTTVATTTTIPTTIATTTTIPTTVTTTATVPITTITTPTIASTTTTPVVTNAIPISTFTNSISPLTIFPSITSAPILSTKKYREITESDMNQRPTWPHIHSDHQTTLSIPEIIEEVLKELNLHKKTKLEEPPSNHSNQDKPKKKHDKFKNKNINVKEFPPIYQTKAEKQSETIFQPTTEISFKSILHAETFMNKNSSTKSPLSINNQSLPDLMNAKYVTDGLPFIETGNSKPTMPGNHNQLWHSFKKQANTSETDYKEQEQFSVLKEPSETLPTNFDVTEMNKVVESNTIDYRQSSEEPLKKMLSQEEETNYSLISNKIKFNMTESIAAGVQASRTDHYLHTPMILVLGIALVTLLLLTITLWVYLKRRRERAQPFPPCIMAYDIQEQQQMESDSFNHPFFCPTFTNTYGEKINRELRELSYDHPRSQPEPLYAEIRY